MHAAPSQPPETAAGTACGTGRVQCMLISISQQTWESRKNPEVKKNMISKMKKETQEEWSLKLEFKLPERQLGHWV